jgi:hypothetical protein
MNNKISQEIAVCRVCGSKNIVPLISLGDLYFSDFVGSKNDDPIGKQPLDLFICDPEAGGCGLVQLKHNFSLDALYRNYWYRSGVNKSMTDALKDIAQKAQKIAKPKAGDFVIDIGSNDGTSLHFYENKELNLIGFEPAINIIPYAKKNCPSGEYINNFFNFADWQKKYGDKKAKIITAIAMFYDLEQPNDFIADIAKCLDEKGVFIIQMSYLPLMLKQNAFDNICHEHLEYYSLISLSNLLKRHGLEVFDVELNDVNGGSFRTYIQHRGDRPIKESVRKMEKSEIKMNLGNRKGYEDFVLRVMALRQKTCDFIKKEVAAGKKVYIYGASTKGNTLLQFYGLDKKIIVGAAERNPDKWGKKTVGTLIPIISEDQARKEKPDYFLVLPWHFMKEFVSREKYFLKAGGKFIVPLPKFKIITKNDL